MCISSSCHALETCQTLQSFKCFACNHKRPTCLAEVYQSTELFCGTAWVTKCMTRAGLRTAALDVKMGSPPPGKQNAYDIMTPAGMASFGFDKICMFLNWALNCSLWFAALRTVPQHFAVSKAGNGHHPQQQAS